MISVRFLPAAEIELLREIVYYSKARPGTGVRFQAAVEATVKRAATHPLGGAPSFKETRSMLVKGFPFSVVYRPAPREFWSSQSRLTGERRGTGHRESSDGWPFP